MRNLDMIRAMPVEELAKMLVKSDYSFDNADCDVFCFPDDYYISPNDEVFIDYCDAVEETIRWLNEEVTNENK